MYNKFILYKNGMEIDEGLFENLEHAVNKFKETYKVNNDLYIIACENQNIEINLKILKY